jgi:hypothetical protein
LASLKKSGLRGEQSNQVSISCPHIWLPNGLLTRHMLGKRIYRTCGNSHCPVTTYRDFD